MFVSQLPALTPETPVMKIDEALVVCVSQITKHITRCYLGCMYFMCFIKTTSIVFFFFVKVPESGNYTFYVSCDDACELWLHTFENSNDDEEIGKILLAEIQQEYSTGHNQWNK